MQCTERFMLLTYITYFADTGFWETGQLQPSIQCISKKKIWAAKVVGVSKVLLLSTGSLSLEVSMMEMPWQMYTRWLVAKAVKDWCCKIRAVTVQDWGAFQSQILNYFLSRSCSKILSSTKFMEILQKLLS